MRHVLLFGLLLFASRAATAQLVCDDPHFDFGRRHQQETFTGEFVVRNSSETEKIYIQSVKITCFCAKGSVRKHSLAPGESTTIEFTFKTSAFEGEVRKPVVIRYGRKGLRELELSVGGTVVPSWAATTQQIDLGAVRAGQVVRRSLEVTRNEGFEVDVTAVAESRQLRVTRKARPEGDGWTIEIEATIPATSPPGDVRYGLNLRSTDRRKPSQRIWILGVVEADLRVTPRFLAFGGIEPTKRVAKSIVLESASGKPFKLVELRDDRFLLLDAELGVAAPRHEVEVVAPEGLPAGSQRGSLVIRTDRADEAIVRIGYSFRVKKP